MNDNPNRQAAADALAGLLTLHDSLGRNMIGELERDSMGAPEMPVPKQSSCNFTHAEAQRAATWLYDNAPGIVALLRAEVAGPVVAGEVERAEWMSCVSRAPWVSNSLKRSAADMRASEKRCRGAFNKDWMGEPARYVADAYGEAAAAFERRLANISPLVYADTAKGNVDG